LPTDPNFSANLGTGLTFDDPTQQQHCLRRSKVPPFKDCPAVQIVDTLALVAAVDHQLAGLSLPKLAGLVQPCLTVGAFQPIRVKVFEQPLAAQFIIYQFYDWKVHTFILPHLALVLYMSQIEFIASSKGLFGI
jgi:hypothetical protein